jgi:heme ABC exporter ATP-binding subunit CcmA
MPSPDAEILLDARGLHRSFGRARVLRGVDLAVRPGELVVVLGPNGAGKTTLLRLLAGLARPRPGEIRIMGQQLNGPADPRRSMVGFVSHQSLLYDDLTLEENLAFAARLHRVASPRRAAATVLASAGLAERTGDLPRNLSRGLLQRAAVARALLHSPRILLLDEPFTGLDTVGSEWLRAELRSRLADRLGIVMVTHQLPEIWDLAARVAVLMNGSWALEQPRSGSVDAFLGRYHGLTGA